MANFAIKNKEFESYANGKTADPFITINKVIEKFEKLKNNKKYT